MVTDDFNTAASGDSQDESQEVTSADDPNSANTDESHDPFSPENASMLNFIMQARIYDVLLALLTETNAELARDLLELHSTGNIMGSAPAFNGKFIANIINESD